MVAQLKGAIASEVQRQVRELLDDPERLATLLDYSLRRQRGAKTTRNNVPVRCCDVPAG